MSKKAIELSLDFTHLSEFQKALVVQHLWLVLGKTFAKMRELNGPQVPIDLMKRLMLGVKNTDTAGIPLDQEKPAIDIVLRMLGALATFEADDKSSHDRSE